VSHYDAIVIGVGGVGSAALYHLARRGARAIGLDRFPPGHDRGSSHGETRMIRLAYHEHPDYVPLLLRAYELWNELELETQKTLYHQVGILVAGPSEGDLTSGVLRSAAEHGLPIEQFSVREAGNRYAGYQLPSHFCGLFEQRAGYLMVEDCVKAHVAAAIHAGAELRSDVAVRGWRLDGSTVLVETEEEIVSADRLIVTAGAWASDLLASLNVSFQVLRKPLFWYRTREPSYQADLGCPCFLFETLGGIFYGFPQMNKLGVKLAEHTNGEPITDPLEIDRSLRTTDQQRIEACLMHHLPGVSRECTAHSVCMYTMSADGHFVVGQHPEFPQVAFTAGLSGHGFKFTPVLGEIMSQLALDGETCHPIEFLSHRRFAT
jgi:sarcosine oxidase